jgi:hypothetical protein
MDDFNISSLHESKNEWGARLVTILAPLIIEGFKSIFEESFKLCKDNDEIDKYLMTFQNFIARIPKWNPTIIEQEKQRIIEKSGCSYLEDLVTCVHIIQLKILTSMRVGQKQKKIDINIPKLDDFIHKSYINSARKIYKNVYLFEINIPPLQVQKHQRELELIIQECILNAVRESIPIENILRAYMDETLEEEIIEEVKEEKIASVVEPPKPQVTQHIVEEQVPKNNVIVSEVPDMMEQKIQSMSTLKFNDVDNAIDSNNKEEFINAPKTIERLEEISAFRNNQRKLENDDDEDDDNEKLNISGQDMNLDDLVDVINFDRSSESAENSIPDLLFDDIEILN